MVTEREHWDSVAGDPPHTMIRHGDWDEGIAADLAMLPAPNAYAPVLDLGSGLGRLSVAYRRKFDVPVIGVDVSSEMIEAAQTDPLVAYVHGDGRSLPGGVTAFAAAFSVLMFQHIPRGAQHDYVTQVAERLRPGARFTFQLVVGDEDTFLSHQVEDWWPFQMCEAAGLEVESSVEAVYPQWLWTTARKPE